jgi:hypothetical protein
MQESEVEFINLTANNGTISPTGHTNDGPSGSACAADFATQDISGGIETIIGGQFPPVASPTPVITPTPVKKTPTSTPTPTVTPVVTPATAPTTTSTTNQAKPSKPIATTLSLKTYNKARPLSLTLAAAYTAGIGIPVILIVFGIFFFERILPQRRRLANQPGDPDLHPSPEVFVSSLPAEPMPTSYPQLPTIPLTPSTPVIAPLPADPVPATPPQPIQPTIITPTDPPPKE